MEQWILDFHDRVEALNVEGVVGAFSPDVEVAVANNPVMKGREAAAGGLGYLFGAIAGLKHHYLNTATNGRQTFLEMRVDYTRQDGKTVTVPATTVIERQGSLISALRIYVDMSPVFAA